MTSQGDEPSVTPGSLETPCFTAALQTYVECVRILSLMCPRVEGDESFRESGRFFHICHVRCRKCYGMYSSTDDCCLMRRCSLESYVL